MKRALPFLASALLLTACGGGGPSSSSSSSSSAVVSSSSVAAADIVVDAPVPNATITSPLTVTGRARGTWYFEATFPVKLLDGNGNLIASGPAQAQGDWMTSDFVPFTASLTYVQPPTPMGTLVLQKDNPSGEPQNDASVSVPVAF